MVQQMSPRGRKTQTAAVVSQKTTEAMLGSHQGGLYLPHRRGGDVSQRLMWKHLHHRLSCLVQLGSQRLTSTKGAHPEDRAGALSHHPGQRRGESFSCAVQVNEHGRWFCMQAYYESETR